MDAIRQSTLPFSTTLKQEYRSLISACGFIGLAGYLSLTMGLWVRSSLFEPLPIVGCVVALLVAGLFGWLIRLCLWTTLPSQSWAHFVGGTISLGSLALALALSSADVTPTRMVFAATAFVLMEGSPLLLLLGRGQFSAAGLLSWDQPSPPGELSPSHVSSPSSEPPPANPRHSSSDAPHSYLSENSPSATTAPVAEVPAISWTEQASPGLVQRGERIAREDGTVAISMRIYETLAPGQRHAQVHVAFCPPLAAAPQVSVETIEGAPTTIKVAEVLPMGARIELRLTKVSQHPEQIVLQVLAEGKPLDL